MPRPYGSREARHREAVTEKGGRFTKVAKESIAKVYDPKSVEDKWYQYWLDNDVFHSEPHDGLTPYTIVIPPPNVTDVLHMGHAYNNTIQDIFIRYRRMSGFETLWMPGTDHAGIATQNVLEKSLAKEGLTRHDLGREKFVERVWQWRENYGSTIIRQLKKLGSSCDWVRERFTMDEGLSAAVLEVFVQLYEKGLIYRGKYIINWCPRCRTALSDEEAVHREHNGHLWYVKYPLSGSEGFITVATTRPETMLGDTGVAVNPNDSRYKGLAGDKAVLPILERALTIVEDEFVDPEFGTGAVKVTPAHDPNDFVMGDRHGLEQVNVLNEDATINANGGKYAGMDRVECRDQLVADLEELGLLEKIEPHVHAVAHCQRCDTVLEPYLSEQWFVKIKPLAEPALQAVKDGRTKFHPERWTRVYEHWMENIRDWCISRQLWWGHRIPVYYCDACGEMMVCRSAPEKCAKCGSASMHQDEDVLDTWFSSWLWPFSTMGWPETTKELEYYYPTDTLVTGPDIIFFWVARMIMAGMWFCGDVPFRDVYIHGIIRDAKGRRMSKSLGTGIDPLEMIEKYSADAVRFSMIMLSSEGQDVRFDETRIELGRNFSNKIWNAQRFLMMNIEENVRDTVTDMMEGVDRTGSPTSLETRPLEDRWILSRLHRTIERVTSCLDGFRLSDAISSIYHFFWHEYCDWYLEMIKPRLYGKRDGKEQALAVALVVLRDSMKLLHPFIPFITEEIWQMIPARDRPVSIAVDAWPKSNENLLNPEIEREADLVQRVTFSIRNMRSEMNVPPATSVRAIIRPGDATTGGALKNNVAHIMELARCSEVVVDADAEVPEQVAKTFLPEAEVFLPLEGVIDIAAEKRRLTKEHDRVSAFIERARAKLASQDFVNKAPAEVVEQQREKLAEFEQKLSKLDESLSSLG
jgi:valyl-tRNA synthetase